MDLVGSASLLNVTFRTPWGVSDLREFEPFLRGQALDYRGYQDWATKAAGQLYAGEKQVILAFDQGSLVGNVMYQPHRTIPGMLEIKNSRVDPRVRRRSFVTFMKKQVEHYAREHGYAGIIKDVRATHPDALAVTDLYGEGEEDFVMVRWLDRDRDEQVRELSKLITPNAAIAQRKLETILA